MLTLDTQEQFESLWFDNKGEPFFVWFSAKWCGPCQKMDKALLQKAADTAGAKLYYCDHTVNDYTPGWCNVRAFPTFMYVTPPRKIASQLTNSDTQTVCNWMLAVSR